MKPVKASFLCINLLVICFLILATAVVFTQTEKEKKEPPLKVLADKEVRTNDVLIGYMQTRDKIVAISRGAKGSVYTVKTKDGKVLASNLNEKDFEEKYPALFSQVKYGLAGNDATLRKNPAVGPFDKTDRGIKASEPKK